MAAIGVVFNKMINRSIIHEVRNFSEANKNITTQIFKENIHISSGEGFDNDISFKWFITFRLKLSQLFSFIMHLYFIVQLNSYYVDHENIPQVSLEKFDEDSTYWYDLPIYILFLWGCIYAFLLLWFVVTMYLCFKYMIFRFCNISCRIGEDSIIDVNE